MRARRFMLLLSALCVVAVVIGVGVSSALAAPPTVFATSFGGAGSSSVTFHATINPQNSNTTYKFEYGTTDGYGSSTPTAAIGAGTSNVDVQQQLEGLQPDTTYHFRLVTDNESGEATGADTTFSTYPVDIVGLPDHRGYEKVSPTDNADRDVYSPGPVRFSLGEGSFTNQPFIAAANGDAMTYIADPSETGGTGIEGGDGGNQYLATRAPDGGWSAVNVTPPSEELFDVPVYQAFSSNLEVGFLTSNSKTPLAPGAPGGGYHVPYLRTFASGNYEPLLTTTPPNRGAEEFGAPGLPAKGYAELPQPVFAGSSTDFKHVLYMANDALTTNAVSGGYSDNNLYDWNGGNLTLVNVLPNGNAEPNATFGGPAQPPDEGEYNPPNFNHVISEDGSRIFWTGLTTGDLYMRENDSRTVQIDAAVGGKGLFWNATPDGSKVLFTKGGDLYEYRVNEGTTTDLTPGAEVQGVLTTSENLSYIYFVADAALAGSAEHQQCLRNLNGEGTGCNLYLLQAGEPVKFIAKLSSKDNFSAPTGPMSFYSWVGDWQGGLGYRGAEATPDGRYLVFQSVLSLTGYENEGYKEVYVYDVEGGQIFCASCNPSGEPPLGAAADSGYLPASGTATYLPRWMSDDGSRVFFESLDPLVTDDTNGVGDAYEWERDGAGSCDRSDGCIYLLSGGTSTENSYFVDASANGSDAFFVTRAQLTPED